MVIDLGASSLHLTLLGSFGGVYEVIAAASDATRGCTRLDHVISIHLAAEFKKKSRMDVSDNARARAKLVSASEGAKRALSSSGTALCSIESLHEGMDLQVSLNRQLFDVLASSYYSSLQATIAAFTAANNATAPHTVLLIGGGAAIPKVKDLVSAMFPSSDVVRPAASDEAVAVGAAIEGTLTSVKQGGF